MYNNNNNLLKTNINENKQLSVKAYLMNKYDKFNEQLKDPPSNLLNDNNFNSFIIDSPMNINILQQHNQQQQQQQLLLSTPTTPSTPTASATSTSTSNNNNNNMQQLMQTGFKVKRHFSGGSNSSLQNSDEDDDDFEDNSSMAQTREEKRRISHTAAEQKRRNAIKHGYDELQSLVPSCEYMDPSSSQKVCKATILKRSIDYINELENERIQYENNLDSLKKEILALKILKSNYEEILKCHRNTPKDNAAEINDEAKFELFTKISDYLFQSFNAMVTTNKFPELSATMLNWLEQVCTAQNLKNLIILSLQIQQLLH